MRLLSCIRKITRYLVVAVLFSGFSFPIEKKILSKEVSEDLFLRRLFILVSHGFSLCSAKLNLGESLVFQVIRWWFLVTS